MSTKHSHHRINESQVHTNLYAPFKPRQHNANNLADLVISFSQHRDSALSDLQKVVLHDFHNELKFDLREHITFSTVEVMSAYFGFLDDLFFVGSLRECCELSIDRHEAERRGQVMGKEVKRKNNVVGFLFRVEGEKYVIVLDSQPDEFEGWYEKMKAYVEMLLHLMIHAFLELWTCGFSSCRDGFEKLGKTGYGRVWQDMALAVEEAARDGGFLNLNLRLERELGLALEMVTMKESARREDLERWGMSGEDVENAIEALRERQEVDDGSSKVPERTETRKLGVLQRFLLGAEAMGRDLHAYRLRQNPSRHNSIKEEIAGSKHSKKNPERVE